ncbi:unnamed protein product [Pseudo-nitzschia multistriata]|uniref:Uncharacterized protein n=1 Tax=Pseudo-nitzschia multistriata TaxID=183589 RepID=A0A448ZFM6_9STRA|nr:unnamed protein product [Pseudo-nitzschia multistriata]
MALSIDYLGDDVLMEIMTFACYGAGPLEVVSPSARFAHVSKWWRSLYQKVVEKGGFVTNEIREITASSMAISSMSPETAFHFGGPVPRLRDPVFFFWFDRSVTIRAICFIVGGTRPSAVKCIAAPRHLAHPLFTCFIDKESGESVEIPELPDKYAVSSELSFDRADYAKIVAHTMPQGKAASEEDHTKEILPCLLKNPVKVDANECFCIFAPGCEVDIREPPRFSRLFE